MTHPAVPAFEARSHATQGVAYLLRGETMRAFENFEAGLKAAPQDPLLLAGATLADPARGEPPRIGEIAGLVREAAMGAGTLFLLRSALSAISAGAPDADERMDAAAQACTLQAAAEMVVRGQAAEAFKMARRTPALAVDQPTKAIDLLLLAGRCRLAVAIADVLEPDPRTWVRASALTVAGDYDKAIALLEKPVEAIHSAMFAQATAVAHLASGDVRRAAEALANVPPGKNEHLGGWRAWVALLEGDRAKALELLRAVDADPLRLISPPAMTAQAVLLELEGDKATAARLYRRAATVWPGQWLLMRLDAEGIDTGWNRRRSQGTIFRDFRRRALAAG